MFVAVLARRILVQVLSSTGFQNSKKLINIVFPNGPVTYHSCGQKLVFWAVFKVLTSKVIIRPSFNCYLVHASWKFHKYHIPIRLVNKLAVFYLFQSIKKVCGVVIGLAGKIQPKIIF